MFEILSENLIHSSRRRELLIGLLLILAPVILFPIVHDIVDSAPTKPWIDDIGGTYDVLDVALELWGFRRLLNVLKKFDFLAVCAALFCLLSIFLLVLGIVDLIGYR